MFISTSKVFLASVLMGMTLFISGCDGKKAAKEEIEQKGITYNIDSFAEAIASKNTDVINLFIKAGIDAANPKALGAVIESNDPMLLEKLLDEDLNPNIKITTDGSNAPLLNKIVSSPEMLKVLLEADELYINAQDNEGNTALMQAMIDNQPPSVTLLVTAGADVNMRNKVGLDVHLLAFGNIADNFGNLRDETQIIPLLKALGEKLNPNATIDNLPFIKKEKAVGLTLLHLACFTSKGDLASFLVGKKANVNAKIKGFNTPLMIVLSNGSTQNNEVIANMLLDNGADKSGALDIAINNMASEKLLKRLGATKEDIRRATAAATEEVAPAQGYEPPPDAAAAY
jgi:ankyrin repeat protein